MLGHWRAWRGWWISQRCSSWTFWEFGTTFVWKPLLQVYCSCSSWLLSFSEICFSFFPVASWRIVYLSAICSSSRLGLTESSLSSGSSASRKSLQSRLLCFVVTAIAKLATHHRDLLPRARVSLAKVSLVILNPLTQKKCWIWSLLKNHRINNDCKLLIQTERKMIANEETLWLCSVA